MVTNLEPVQTTEDVREAIDAFNSVAAEWPYARKLLRLTSYWVYDPTDDWFGPAKFVGFAGLDDVSYDAALGDDFTGARFDGGVTSRAVEVATGQKFHPDHELTEQLHTWAETLFGEPVFDDIDESKWKFIRLPEALMRPGRPGASRTRRASQSGLGRPYEPASEDSTAAPRDPFEVDPDKVDRGNNAHARTQNALAAFLEENGLEPRSPDAGDPEFDIAWERDSTTFVGEVKSITNANEEKQLRLGLGQVLRYRHLMNLAAGDDVVAVLVAEHEPKDPSWLDTCAALGVVLVWPGVFERLIPHAS